MKTILLALLFLTACSTVPSLTVQRAAERTPEPLVAKFEPSIPPPPTMNDGKGRAPSSVVRTVKPLSDGEIQNLWTHVNNERKDSLIRSNPAHYWAWMNKNLPDKLKPVADFQGQAVADAHYFNFGDVHGKSKSGLAVVDVDDSGLGSLYLDFVRYAIFVKAYMKMDLTKELFTAYRHGLLGEKDVSLPDSLKQAFSKSRKDLLEEHVQWVQKNTKNSKLDNKALKIQGLKNLPKEISETGKKLAELLKKSNKAKEVFDIGYMVSDSGSSRGMARYWFSLLSPKEHASIYECKQLSDPATAYYAPQKNHSERIADVLKVYADVETDDSYVMATPNTSYWCRPKHFDFLDRDLIEGNRKNTKSMIDFSRYLAYWMGTKHASQTEGKQLLETFEASSRSQILDDTIDLISQYEAEINKLGVK